MKQLILIFVLLCFFGCGSQSKKIDKNKIEVYATLFPVYDISRAIFKEKANIHLVIPPGVEAHTYEPSPKDIINFSNGDIFIYTSKIMEPWAEKIVTQLPKENIISNSSQGVNFLDGKDEDEGDEHKEEHHHLGKDPHIWLDPENMKIMAENVYKTAVLKDKKNEKYYKLNYENYCKELDKIDQETKETINKCKIKTIIYGGHYAFGYFSKRYGLNHESPYENFSPNSEPTPKNIKEMVELTKKLKVKYIFFEEMLSPKVAEIIAKESNTKMLLLNGAHNISKKDLDNGITYFKIMQENLENLKKGLDFSE